MTSIILNRDVRDLIRHRQIEDGETLCRFRTAHWQSTRPCQAEIPQTSARDTSGQVQRGPRKDKNVPESGKSLQCIAIPRAGNQEG